MGMLDISLERATELYVWGWRLSIIGAVITALGVALLMWGTRVRDHDFEFRMTQANKDAAQANRDAATANERAAGLEKDAARLRLQLDQEIHKRAPRILRDDQKAALVAALKKERLDNLLVISRDEDEPTQYAVQFIQALHAAGLLDATTPWITTNKPQDNWPGIRLYIPNAPSEEAYMNDPLTKAFEAAKIPIDGVSGCCQSGVVLDPNLNRQRRTIYIGRKPFEP
jgi:hypothetical protein